MNVYLLRHLHALDVGECDIQTDEERPLSEEGLRRAAHLAEGLRRMGVTFDRVVSSPLVRGVQTAKEIHRLMGLGDVPITVCDKLAPDQSSKKVGKFLLTLEEENVLLVGHAPSLGLHAAWLIGSRRAQISLAKGAIACIRCEGPPRKGAGILSWLITPKLLAALREEHKLAG